MRREIEGWHSPSLGQHMPIVSYGDWGHPLLLFPTAAADFLENERFCLVEAIEPAIDAGRVRVFSINSINNQAWMDRSLPVPEQARRQALYARYIEEEVVPYIRQRLPVARPPHRHLGRELRRLPRRQHAVPPAGPLRRRHRHERLLRPRAGLPARATATTTATSTIRPRTCRTWRGTSSTCCRRSARSRSSPARGPTRRRTPRGSCRELLAQQGHPALPGHLGPRREPRLALVAQDAAVRDREDGLVRL